MFKFNDKHDVHFLVVLNEPWFRAKDVATLLDYKDTNQAIRVNVDDDDRRKLEELGVLSDSPLDYHTKTSIYINESGLYALILKSTKPEAKQFQRWITKDVLPSIRKHGKYESTPTQLTLPEPSLIRQLNIFNDTMINQNHTINLNNETQLHYKVVDFTHKNKNTNFPDARLLISLGELQNTSESRIDAWNKGYIKGVSDIIINNYHLKYSQLIIELKNPRGTGTLSDAQENYLSSMVLNDAKIIVSNDYDYIVNELYEYFKDVRVMCHLCNRKKKFYTSVSNLNKHIECFHNRNKK